MTHYLVPIDIVCPWDRGHTMETLFEKDHYGGIQYIKECIIEGRFVMPILVSDFKDDTPKERSGPWFVKNVLGIYLHNFQLQRLDGFKRYMAFKELGFLKILVWYHPHARNGGQQGEPLIVPAQFNWEKKSQKWTMEYLIQKTILAKKKSV